MREDQLIQKICDRGLASVKKYEKGAKREGGIKGFELARQAKNIEDIIQLFEQQQKIDRAYRTKIHHGHITYDEYWRQRYITLQLEHVLEILKVAHRGEYKMLSARAIREYAKIVGVKGE